MSTWDELKPQEGVDYFIRDRAIWISHDYIDSDRFVPFSSYMKMWTVETYLEHMGIKPTEVEVARLTGDSPSTISRARTKLEYYSKSIQREGYVYVIQAGPYYKIGHAINVSKRLEQYAPKLPWEVTLIHSIQSADRIALESYLHKRFADKRCNGEWFELDEEDVAWLKTQ